MRGDSISASSTAHRDKRPFQPSIHRFFAREDRATDFEERGQGPITRRQHNTREQAARDSLNPSVPEAVQVDLLSVGTRIRKSVPEGYKTHKATLPSMQTSLSKSPNTIAANGDAYSVKPPRDPVPVVLQHQRELLPFCGLNKIGGYAEQPVTNVHLYAGTDSNGDRPVNMFPLPAEAFHQPFSSRDSTNSDESLPPNPANPHKRSWLDDDTRPLNLSANFLFTIPMKVSEDEVPVSPLSATPAQSINALPQAALRPFAQPKTRRQGVRVVEIDGALFKEADMDLDLENAEHTEERVVSSSNDFGEAEFLRPWSGREVEMGGLSHG